MKECGGLGKGNLSTLKDVFLIDDNLNVQYVANNGKEYGDTVNNKILEDETKIRFANKAFSEYVSKISGITEEEMKFKWMKNQTTLIIADSSIDSLEDLVFFPNLTSLPLGEYGPGIPQITTLDGIENCTKLTTLTIIRGPDKDYTALANCPNFKNFDKRYGSDYNNIIDGLKLCKNLKNCLIRDLVIGDNIDRISELGDLEVLDLSSTGINKIMGLENKPSLKQIVLANNKITKIERLENLSNLKQLYLNNNQITDITPLSANTALTNLDLRRKYRN